MALADDSYVLFLRLCVQRIGGIFFGALLRGLVVIVPKGEICVESWSSFLGGDWCPLLSSSAFLFQGENCVELLVIVPRGRLVSSSLFLCLSLSDCFFHFMACSMFSSER